MELCCGLVCSAFSGDSISLKEATGPRLTDHRTRTSYRADRKAEQQEILERHRRGLHFVGDWHTHPSPRPSPSDLDYRSIQESVRHSAHELQGFVLIVVGTLRGSDGLHVSINDGDRAFVLHVSSDMGPGVVAPADHHSQQNVAPGHLVP